MSTHPVLPTTCPRRIQRLGPPLTGTHPCQHPAAMHTAPCGTATLPPRLHLGCTFFPRVSRPGSKHTPKTTRTPQLNLHTLCTNHLALLAAGALLSLRHKQPSRRCPAALITCSHTLHAPPPPVPPPDALPHCPSLHPCSSHGRPPGTCEGPVKTSNSWESHGQTPGGQQASLPNIHTYKGHRRVGVIVTSSSAHRRLTDIKTQGLVGWLPHSTHTHSPGRTTAHLHTPAVEWGSTCGARSSPRIMSPGGTAAGRTSQRDSSNNKH